MQQTKSAVGSPLQWTIGDLFKYALRDLLNHALDVSVQTGSMECMFELAKL